MLMQRRLSSLLARLRLRNVINSSKNSAGHSWQRLQRWWWWRWWWCIQRRRRQVYWHQRWLHRRLRRFRLGLHLHTSSNIWFGRSDGQSNVNGLCCSVHRRRMRRRHANIRLGVGATGHAAVRPSYGYCNHCFWCRCYCSSCRCGGLRFPRRVIRIVVVVALAPVVARARTIRMTRWLLVLILRRQHHLDDVL